MNTNSDKPLPESWYERKRRVRAEKLKKRRGPKRAYSSANINKTGAKADRRIEYARRMAKMRRSLAYQVMTFRAGPQDLSWETHQREQKRLVKVIRAQRAKETRKRMSI